MSGEVSQAALSSLGAVFEQSWEYVRHAQTMLWQSFAALTAVISFLFWGIYKVPDFVVPGFLLSLGIAFTGLLVTTRAILVTREHMVTINRVRKIWGTDDICVQGQIGLIPVRWKEYGLTRYKATRPEVNYMVVIQLLYIFLICVLAEILVWPRWGATAALVVLVLVLALCVWCASRAWKTRNNVFDKAEKSQLESKER